MSNSNLSYFVNEKFEVVNRFSREVEFEAVKDSEFYRLMKVRNAYCDLIEVLDEVQDINEPNEIIDDESYTDYVVRSDRYLSRMIDILVANDFTEVEANEIIDMMRHVSLTGVSVVLEEVEK